MKRLALKVLAGLLLLGALAGGLFFLLKDSSLFDVRQVRVVGLSGSRALKVKNSALGQSTLAFDEGAVRDAAAGRPPLKSLAVETSPPHQVTITVELYRGVAAVGQTAGSLQAVSANGTVLPGVPVAGLPVVEGSAVGGYVRDRFVLSALKVLESAPREFKGRISSLAKDSKFGLYIVLSPGPRVYFGDTSSLKAKWASASRVLADPPSRGAAYVDVRVPRRPAVGGVSGGVQGGIDPADPNQPVSPDGQAATDTTSE